jgi:hypothetical protein
MEPNTVKGFNAIGLEFHPFDFAASPAVPLDPEPDRQFNNAKSHSSLQIRARTRLEETP